MAQRSGLGCCAAAVVLSALAWAGADQAIWLTSIQPFTGADWDAGISMRIGAEIMLEEVNSNPDLLPGYDLKVVWQDGLCAKPKGTELFLTNYLKETYEVFAPGISLDQLDVDGDGVVTTADVEGFSQVWNSSHLSPRPVGLLGSGCAGTAININQMANLLNYPMVSNSATRPGLSDRAVFPNFWRTIMPDTFFNGAWVAIAKDLGHTEISLVCGELENWGSMVEALVQAAGLQGVTLHGNDLTAQYSGFYGYTIPSDSQGIAASVAQSLKVLRKRMVILQMFHPRNRLLLCEAYKLGYVNAVWMVMGWLPMGWWEIQDTDCDAAAVTGMAAGFISANMQFWRSDMQTLLDCSSSMTAEGFRTEWLSRQNTSLDNLGMRPEGYVPALEAATTADAVCMYAQMLHEMLIVRNVSLESLTPPTKASYITIQEVFAATNFEGIAGTVKFGENKADPDGSVLVQQMQGGQLADIASYLEGTLSYLGISNLVFGLPNETFFAGAQGASSISAELAHFRTCQGGDLNFHNNSCQDCPDGQVYLDVVGACVCKAGYMLTGGECSMCPSGAFSEDPGSEECEQCPVGRFASEEGSTTCARCPIGTYMDNVSAVECISCPSSFTTAGEGNEGPGDCLCGVGTRVGDGGACEECGDEEETGLVCPGTGEVTIYEGFYAADDSLSVYQCFGSDGTRRCVGGPPGSVCAPGREGLGCSQCMDGMKEHSDGSCIPCTEQGNGHLNLVLACLVLVACLVTMYAFVSQRRTRSGSQSLLTAEIVGSMGLILMQQLSILGMFSQVVWDEPMGSFLKVLQLVTFDLDLLNLNCIGKMSPIARFSATTLVFVVCLVVLVLVHIIAVGVLHGWRFKERQPWLTACIGTVFMVFYISVLSAVLEPMQCLKNPNDKLTSRVYQSVICWDSEEHTAMVIIAFAAMIIPLGYLARCCYVVWRFPVAMHEGRTEYFICYSFLFLRFKPEIYWFALMHLFRSLLLALLPAIYDVSVQLIGMQLVVSAHLLFLVFLMPYRVRFANYIEVAFTVAMLFVVGSAGLYVDVQPGPMLSWVCLMLVAVFLLLLPLVGVCALIRYVMLKRKKPFQYFLCHHKAAAGAFARLLKMTLRKRGVSVFVDCDNLTDLDMLFELLGNHTETLVVLLTRELFTRPWCMGEVMTAKAKSLQIVRLAFPDFHEPSDDFITDYESHVQDLSVLSGQGCSLAEAQDALRWIREQRTITVKQDFTDHVLRALVRNILCKIDSKRPPEASQTTDAHDPPSLDSSENPSLDVPSSKASSSNFITTMASDAAGVKVSTTLIVHDRSSTEAIASAMVLAELLSSHLHDHPKEIPMLLNSGAAVPATTTKIILLCTLGALEQENIFRSLLSAMEMTSAKYLPVVADDSFNFPKSSFLDEHRKLAGLVTSDDTMAEELCTHIQSMFLTIGVTFDATMSSATVLDTAAGVVANRLMMTSDAAIRRSATSSRSSGRVSLPTATNSAS